MGNRCRRFADWCNARGTPWLNRAQRRLRGEAADTPEAARAWDAARQARLAAGQAVLTAEDRARRSGAP